MSFETRAVHRRARMGVNKARRVLALVRGLTANEALDQLRHDRHRAGKAIYKVLASAIANALQNPSVRPNRLVISKIFAQDGPPLPGGKRMRPGPQGRAMPFRRRTCHIHVHVADPEAMPVAGADAVTEVAETEVAESEVADTAGAEE
jgi:large subunit ribosomal protein L22